MQNEIDLQTSVSQDFSQTRAQVLGSIDRRLDRLKEQRDNGRLSESDYQTQSRQWQQGKVLLNMLAAGLASPADNTGGLAAATASPALSYRIGQYFKANDLKNQADGGQRPGESSPAHLLAHSILGAAVAASGGHNALTGALSAGGAEAAAPVLSRWLYGKAAADLTADEKQTVAGISGLLGAGIGAATGNSSADAVSGSLSARNAVENNNSARTTRRSARNPLWTEAQARQHELNSLRIKSLIESIRRIEPNFKGIASFRDPNRPISNEEVQIYEQYFRNITSGNVQHGLSQASFATNLSPITNRPSVDVSLRGVSRDLELNNLGQAFNARPRVEGHLDARSINLQIGLKTIRPNQAASRNGMPVYSGVSEREVFSLYERYTGSLPEFRTIPGRGELASSTIQSGNWKGTTIVLRNFSTSREQTGAKWTIEFQNFPNSIRGTGMELKFR